jgi:hypothetical protein
LLKLAVPEQGSFGEREARQLAREASVLELFTASRCEHAVHLAGVEAVRIKAELAWFVTEPYAKSDSIWFLMIS